MRTYLSRIFWILAVASFLAACTTPHRPLRYPGNCYSPYDRAKDGSLCGRRAALMRPGGY
ncbi:hypothetical protein DXT90_07970 [Agrobacterium tumefaciens]|nr:hypothetical protein [Agrobacterium tumefaciens]